MTTREKTIAGVVGAVVGLYVLDQALLSPLLDRLSAADKKTASHVREASSNNDIKLKRLAASKAWGPLAGNRMKPDASSAESQMLNRVRELAQQAGVAIPSYQSDKADKEMGYDRQQLSITANGNMRQFTRFMYALQTTDVPIKIASMQFKSRSTEGRDDDLTAQIKLVTIFQPPTTPPKVASAGRSWEAFQ